MKKKNFELTEHEERIIGLFENKVVQNGGRIPRKVSRRIFEEAREELLDRARERRDWGLISQLYNPEPGTRAETLLKLHTRTLYEETNGKLQDFEEAEERSF